MSWANSILSSSYTIMVQIAWDPNYPFNPHMGSLTKCVPEICGSVQKKICSYVLFDLAAQGCLQCPKRLQKWKVQTICDRGYAVWFPQSRPVAKVVTDWTSKSGEAVKRKRVSNTLQWILITDYYCYNSKLRRTLHFITWALLEVWWHITFDLMHARKKSGTQLRSQIVWTFHFCNRFGHCRHPWAVRSKST